MAVLKKYCIALLLLLSAAFSLHAQFRHNIYVFFPSITGTGYGPDDNKTLVNMLTAELSARHYTMVNTPQGADFLLYGLLGLFDKNEDYTNGIQPTVTYTYNAGLQDYDYEQLYIFQLILRKIDTGETILHNIVYAVLEDTYNFFPIIVNNLLMHIGSVYPADLWPDRWMHLGASAFWTPRVYYGPEKGLESVPFDNFGAGVSMEIHFWKYLSFELGVELALDRVGYSATESYQNLIFEVPFALKCFLKPSAYFMVAPYVGVHVNAPLFKTTEPPLAAWMVGVTGGVRAGQHGTVFIDPRFSMDIGRSKLNLSASNPTSGASVDYQRIIVHIGIGYKHSFADKK